MVEATVSDPCDAMSREEIKNHLIAMADRHIEASATYKELKVDAGSEMRISQGLEDGTVLTVCMMKAAGLTMEDFIGFVAPECYGANIKILDPILTCRKLDDDLGEGCYAMYQHIKTPFIVSNRCAFVAVYNIDLPNGGMINLTTSKGMSAIAGANVPLQGKDVLSNTILTYIKMEPCEDGSGLRVSHVLAVDPAGSLPDVVKASIAKTNSDAGVKMVTHLRKQKGL